MSDKKETLRINLENGYAIVDGNGVSYDLVKKNKKADKNGKIQDTTLSYHSTVANALKGYARLVASIEIKGDITLREYLDRYDSVVDRIDNLVGER